VTAGPMAPLRQDRVRTLRWAAADVELPEVVEQLSRLESELAEHDTLAGEQPHPRNCALNLVVIVGDRHRAEACDQLVAGLGPSHPLRAILLHLGGRGSGLGTLDAEIVSEAHHLVTGFPIQREQVLLHVRGEAVEHLDSLVEPLLVPDVPTYFWWDGEEPLDGPALREAMRFADVLVVDSTRFDRPAEVLLQLAAVLDRTDVAVGLRDFRWGRLRPWRDAIGQFFAPEPRQRFLRGLREVISESAGTGPASRVGAALLAGWAAASLGWRFTQVRAAGTEATEAVARTPAGHDVRLTLRSAPESTLQPGDLQAVRIRCEDGGEECRLAIEREGGHARVSIDMGGAPTVHQRLTLPREGDPDLLVNVLWASRRDPVFERSLVAAKELLEALR
jgi:glucose-6-phosphate dehydrogenase assembly protein OpcA